MDDEPAEAAEMPGVTDPELRQLLGLFDTPAFARRGQELAWHREAVLARCRSARGAMLEMVRLRLRQWAAVAIGPDDGIERFAVAPAALWPLAFGPEATGPAWAAVAGMPGRRKGAARDLATSVARFNRRWDRFLVGLDLTPLNRAVADYNRYYLLEKECVLGSSRLAARHFRPEPEMTVADLRASFPALPGEW